MTTPHPATAYILFARKGKQTSWKARPPSAWARDTVFQQRKIAAAENGFGELNAPYDAKVVGDYTGLTPP